MSPNVTAQAKANGVPRTAIRRPTTPVRAQMAHLADEIRRHDYLYYVLDRAEVSDSEYDRLCRELRDLEGAHPDLVSPDSPTRRVAGAPRPSLPPLRALTRAGAAHG